MVTIDSPATNGSLASRLLEGLGDPRFDKGIILNRMIRVEKYIDACQAKMVMIDEIQHFADRDKKTVLHTVTDALKNLIKTKHLACILSGMEGESEQIVESNPQLDRLFSDPLVLHPFMWDEERPETIREFCTLLSELEKILPFRMPSNLHKKEMAWRFFVATDGLMAFLMTLIREATVNALSRGLEFIDLGALAEVFDDELAKNKRSMNNPFIGDLPDYRPPNQRKKKYGKR